MSGQLTIEHFCFECFLKCAHTIIGARVYSPARNVPEKRSSKWFLMAIEEAPGVAQQVEPWRRDLSSPMVIEVYLQPWGNKGMTGLPTEQAAAGAPGEMLLERWTLQYVRSGERGWTGGGGSGTGGSNSAGGRTYLDEASIYKRMILLVRSLYSYVRVLPAYRMARTCKRYQGEVFTISCRIQRHGTDSGSSSGSGSGSSDSSSGASTPAVSVNATSSSGGSKMQQFTFAPVDTPGGQFRASVEYQPSTTVHILEQTTSQTAAPRIITDYIRDVSGRSAGASLGPSATALRPAMSASVYESRRQTADAVGSSPAYDGRATSRPIVRQSWSSKAMQVTLPLSSGGSPVYRRTASSTGHAPGLYMDAHSASPSPSHRQFCAASGPGHNLPSPAATAPLPLSTAPPSTACTASPAAAPDLASATAHPVSSHTAVVSASLPSPAHRTSRHLAGTGGAQPSVLARDQVEAAIVPAGTGSVSNGPAAAESAVVEQRGWHDQPSPSGQVEGTPLADRHVSMPVSIPFSRSSARTRSVVDLQHAAAVYDFRINPSLQADASLTPTAGDRDVSAGDPNTSRAAPSSAPAAPRGMLGLALGAQRSSQPGAPPLTPIVLMGGGAARGAQAVGSDAHPVAHNGGVSAAAVGAEVPLLQQHLPTPSVPPQPQLSPGSAARPPQPPVVRRGAAGSTLGMPRPMAVVGGNSRDTAALQSLASSDDCQSGSCPMSCSPQLPFAFTPTGQSFASLHQAMHNLGLHSAVSRSSSSSLRGTDPSSGPPNGSLPSSHPHHYHSHSRQPSQHQLASGGTSLQRYRSASPGQASPTFLSSPQTHHTNQLMLSSGGVSGITGRDISALATIRRPSWGSRSSSYDVAAGHSQAGGVSGTAGGGGHNMSGAITTLSLSPLQDLLESSLSASMSSSTPRYNVYHASPASPSPMSGVFRPPQMAGTGGMYSMPSYPYLQQQQQQQVQPGPYPQLTYPQGAPGHSAFQSKPSRGLITSDGDAAAALLAEESESDLLPFALDNDAPSVSPGGGRGHGGYLQQQPAQLRQSMQPTGGLQNEERDVAVGAFIRMLQEAPLLSMPLTGPDQPLQPHHAKAELQMLNQQLRQHLAAEN